VTPPGKGDHPGNGSVVRNRNPREAFVTTFLRPCEIYACSNPDCGSKILVIQAPDSAPDSEYGLRCECGSLFERTPLGVSAPEGRFAGPAPGAGRPSSEEPE
jgi:hypothetical protein